MQPSCWPHPVGGAAHPRSLQVRLRAAGGCSLVSCSEGAAQPPVAENALQTIGQLCRAPPIVTKKGLRRLPSRRWQRRPFTGAVRGQPGQHARPGGRCCLATIGSEPVSAPPSR
eukprot:scaffold1754_cov355-Prasinococcus_capsulatus_cf.AAC.1